MPRGMEQAGDRQMRSGWPHTQLQAGSMGACSENELDQGKLRGRSQVWHTTGKPQRVVLYLCM